MTHDRQYLVTDIAMRGTESASSKILFQVMNCTICIYTSVSANRAQAHSERLNVVEINRVRGREFESTKVHLKVGRVRRSERRTDGMGSDGRNELNSHTNRKYNSIVLVYS